MGVSAPVEKGHASLDRRDLTREEREQLRTAIDERQRSRLNIGDAAGRRDAEAVRTLLRSRPLTASQLEAELRLPSNRMRGALKRLRLAGEIKQLPKRRGECARRWALVEED